MLFDQTTGEYQPALRRFPLNAVAVGVANDPPFRRPASRLDDAALWLSFFEHQGESDQPLVEVSGSWGFDPNDVVRETSLPPNNQPRTFGMAINHDGDEDWYAASPELWHHRDLRIPSQKLPARFVVRVTLRGTGMLVDETWWLEIRDGQIGQVGRG